VLPPSPVSSGLRGWCAAAFLRLPRAKHAEPQQPRACSQGAGSRGHHRLRKWGCGEVTGVWGRLVFGGGWCEVHCGVSSHHVWCKGIHFGFLQSTASMTLRSLSRTGAARVSSFLPQAAHALHASRPPRRGAPLPPRPCAGACSAAAPTPPANSRGASPFRGAARRAPSCPGALYRSLAAAAFKLSALSSSILSHARRWELRSDIRSEIRSETDLRSNEELRSVIGAQIGDPISVRDRSQTFS